MGHTGPRTKCDVLRYHIGRFNELFTLEGDKWVYHGERVDAKMTVDLGDMLGGLNYADKAQYGNAPYPTDPDSGGGTTPPSGDPLARCKARQAVSNNCLWVLITPEEAGALEAAGINTHPYNQFYTVGGSGGLGVQERVEPTSPSGYVYVDADQQWSWDVDQAADKRVQELADQQGRTVPPPVNIP